MAWQKAFVSMSTLLEGTPEHALLALSESERASFAPLAAALTNENRGARAKSLAAELALVAQALEALDLVVS